MRRMSLAVSAWMTVLVIVNGCSVAKFWPGTASPDAHVVSAGAQVGQLAPEIEGKPADESAMQLASQNSEQQTDSKTAHLSDYRGNIVVLHFWANF
jgi:hypothetical protein